MYVVVMLQPEVALRHWASRSEFRVGRVGFAKIFQGKGSVHGIQQFSFWHSPRSQGLLCILRESDVQSQRSYLLQDKNPAGPSIVVCSSPTGACAAAQYYSLNASNPWWFPLVKSA